MSTTANDYLLVNEAAEFLGVSPNTIRNWGRDGKITEYRHAVNNYRLFKRSELEKIRKKLLSPTPRRVKPR
jgi:excisionase family DNA binding protein